MRPCMSGYFYAMRWQEKDSLLSLALLCSLVLIPFDRQYHVPGDYLGGDGGMESDYDDVIAPSEFFATDEKGDAPFGDLRGFGPADRAPIYQVHLSSSGKMDEQDETYPLLCRAPIHGGLDHAAPLETPAYSQSRGTSASSALALPSAALPPLPGRQEEEGAM